MKLDGVAQTTTTTGTGDLTLDGTVDGFRTFAEAVTDGNLTWGDLVDYVVEDADGREWGRAQVLEAGPTLKRTTATVYGSTAGGSKISAAGGGVTRVFSATPDALKITTDDLQANGGAVPETDRTNIFGTSQTIRLANATPEAGDAGPEIALATQNSAGDYDVTATLRHVIDSPTDGAEAAGVDVIGQLAGVARALLHVRSDGIAPPGYDRKGVDTAHFKEVWIDGTQVAPSGLTFHPGFTAGDRLVMDLIPRSVSGILGHRLYMHPLFVPRVATVASVAMQVSTWTSSDAERLRLGIYQNSNGRPTDRVWQSAELTVAGAGEIVVSASSEVLAAGWYWLASYCYDVAGADDLSCFIRSGNGIWPTLQTGAMSSYTSGLPAAAPAMTAGPGAADIQLITA